MFGFPLGLWPQSLCRLLTQAVSGMGSFSGLVALCQVRYALATSATLCHSHPSIFLRQNRLKVKGFVISLVSTFLFLCPAEYRPVPKRLGCRVKAPCRYQLSFSMFNDMCGYCPQHWGLTVSLQRLTPCVSNSPGSWEISMGPP